ncbi:lipoate--protein ligase, partial [Limosilactobacillus fermentum]|nr:lipoate--protein ligase [Limosilactobacillus fermentum]
VSDLADAKEYVLSDEDKAAVAKINAEIFSNWDFVYGKSPKAAIQHRQHFDQGTVDFRLQIEGGKIAYLKVYGDFLGQEDVRDFEQRLLGVRYDREAINQTIDEGLVARVFGKITKDEIVDLLVRQE